MWPDIKSSYGVGFGFALAFPLIFLIPPATEFIQHVIEWRIGMFDSLQQAEALANHPARIGFGHVKLAALLIVGLWIVRYIHSGGDRRKTGAISGWAVAGFVPILLVAFGITLAQNATAPLTGADTLGKAGSFAAGLGLFVLGTIVQVLLAGWHAGVPLNDRRMNPFSSICRGLPILFPALGIYYAVFLPLLVVHTALNLAMAFSGPGTTLWILFVVDSLLVGFITTALWGSFHAIYRRGLARAGLEPATI